MKRTRRADQQLSIKVPKASVAPVALILVLATLPALMASPPAMPHILAGAGAWLGWLGSGSVSVSLLLMVLPEKFLLTSSCLLNHQLCYLR